MLTIEEAQRTFQGPNRADYPELKDYAREDIYRDCCGGGALYLAVRMCRTLRLKPGEVVLDLGCGKGETSWSTGKSLRTRKPSIRTLCSISMSTIWMPLMLRSVCARLNGRSKTDPARASSPSQHTSYERGGT